MKRTCLILAALILLPYGLLSQNKTILGADFGYKGDLYQVIDNGDGLLSKPVHGIAYGIFLEQELDKHWSLETGLSVIKYQTTIRLREADHGISNSDGIHSVQVPLALKYRINLWNDRLSVSPFIGYRQAINLSYSSTGGSDLITGSVGSGFTSGSDSSRYEYDEYGNYRQYFSLLEAGFTLDYIMKNDIRWSLRAGYSHGFARILRQEAVYTINDAPEQSATLSTNGSNFQILIGMSYPLSNIWQNRQERIRTRPERQEKRSTAMQARFFLGFDIGYVYNYFDNSSDILIGRFSARDRDQLLTLDATYKVSPHWGIETGFSLQAFWKRYYIMEGDKFVYGGGSRSGKDNFYQTFLNAKYYLYLPGKRLAIVPFTGISLLINHVEPEESDSMFSYRGYMEDDLFIATDTTIISTRVEKLKGNSLLINAGFGLEYAIRKNLILTLRFNYTLGFEEVYQMYVEYIENGDLTSGDIYYKGTNLNFSIGMKIPFGKP